MWRHRTLGFPRKWIRANAFRNSLKRALFCLPPARVRVLAGKGARTRPSGRRNILPQAPMSQYPWDAIQHLEEFNFIGIRMPEGDGASGHVLLSRRSRSCKPQ